MGGPKPCGALVRPVAGAALPVSTALAPAMSDSTACGSQPPLKAGACSLSAATSCAGVGRLAGSLARQARTAGRSDSGTADRSGSWLTTRYSRAGVGPSPKGPLPLAAKARVAPSANTSVAGTTWLPMACSGERNPGEPTTKPVEVSAVPSTARLMPKSMTCGPSAASITLAGLRSRWITPARWISWSASARPTPRARSTGSGKPPCLRTAELSGTPGTKVVASQGMAASVSASTTEAVKAPETARAASTSRRNLARKSSSAANSRRTSFTATVRPPAERPRYTAPMPPAPRRPSKVYGPA